MSNRKFFFVVLCSFLIAVPAVFAAGCGKEKSQSEEIPSEVIIESDTQSVSETAVSSFAESVSAVSESTASVSGSVSVSAEEEQLPEEEDLISVSELDEITQRDSDELDAEAAEREAARKDKNDGNADGDQTADTETDENALEAEDITPETFAVELSNGTVTFTVLNKNKDYILTRYVNVHELPDPKSKVTDYLELDNMVVVKATGSNGWNQVEYDNKTGYIYGEYMKSIKKEIPKVEDTEIVEVSNGKVTFTKEQHDYSATQAVYVRRGPEPSAEAFDVLAADERVRVLSKGSNGWYKVYYDNSITGYVYGDYLKQLAQDVLEADKTLEPKEKELAAENV